MAKEWREELSELEKALYAEEQKALEEELALLGKSLRELFQKYSPFIEDVEALEAYVQSRVSVRKGYSQGTSYMEVSLERGPMPPMLKQAILQYTAAQLLKERKQNVLSS